MTKLLLTTLYFFLKFQLKTTLKTLFVEIWKNTYSQALISTIYLNVVLFHVITDLVSGQGIAIGRVRLFDRLFYSIFLTNRHFTFTFCTFMGHDHSLPEIESQGHRLRSRIGLRTYGLQGRSDIDPQSTAIFGWQAFDSSHTGFQWRQIWNLRPTTIRICHHRVSRWRQPNVS